MVGSRDELVDQIGRLEARRAAIKATVGGAARGASVGTNLLLSGGAPQLVAAAGAAAAGREADRRMRKAGAGVRAVGNALLPDYIAPPRNALLGAR